LLYPVDVYGFFTPGRFFISVQPYLRTFEFERHPVFSFLEFTHIVIFPRSVDVELENAGSHFIFHRFTIVYSVVSFDIADKQFHIAGLYSFFIFLGRVPVAAVPMVGIVFPSLSVLRILDSVFIISCGKLHKYLCPVDLFNGTQIGA